VATVTAWATNPDATSTFAVVSFDAIVGATAPTASQNATAVWEELTATARTAGTYGQLHKDNVNATISSRMATYTQPTGFLAAVFPGTVASTTNITAGTITTASAVTTLNGIAANVITATSIAADAITDAKVAADVTIASVTGAVGSVTGAVGSVAGNVGGSVASVTGAVGSVTGAVGSVTGAVGSVTGNVGGNVVGSVASVSAGVNATSIDGSTNAAANLRRGTLGSVLATVGAASTATSIVTSSLDPAANVTDQFKGRIITFDRASTTVALRGQATDITASTAAGVLTVTALTTAPVSGDTFVIT